MIEKVWLYNTTNNIGYTGEQTFAFDLIVV